MRQISLLNILKVLDASFHPSIVVCPQPLQKLDRLANKAVAMVSAVMAAMAATFNVAHPVLHGMRLFAEKNKAGALPGDRWSNRNTGARWDSLPLLGSSH